MSIKCTENFSSQLLMNYEYFWKHQVTFYFQSAFFVVPQRPTIPAPLFGHLYYLTNRRFIFRSGTFQDVFSGIRTPLSDIDCILTFSLDLSVPTLRQFCRLRSTIRYDDDDDDDDDDDPISLLILFFLFLLLGRWSSKKSLMLRRFKSDLDGIWHDFS